MFRQEHQPGMRALSDFTQLKGTVITINGCPLEHKLFHFRLEWSRWSWMRVVTGGESFTALAEGLQEALGQLGGVPAEHRTALTQHFCYPTRTVASSKLLLWLCDK